MKIVLIDANLIGRGNHRFPSLTAMALIRSDLPDVYEGLLALRFDEPRAHSPPATAGSLLRRALSRRREVCA